MSLTKTQSYHDKKRRHAERQIDAIVRRIKRATTSLDLWQRRARYHTNEAQITDEEREARTIARREARAAKARKGRTRLIDVED